MPSIEKLEVTPTKAGVIVRLIGYLLLIFPILVFMVLIGIEEARTNPGGWMIIWIFMLIFISVLSILDFIEGILGYFHRYLLLTEKECCYINAFGKRRDFQLDEVSYSLRYFKNGSRLILRDGKGEIIARLVCDYSLKNVEKIRPFIDSHRKQ